MKTKCDYFLENVELFWFIPEYFGYETLDEMVSAAMIRDEHRLLQIANDIWFSLPDDRFNIIENPSGWEEFLMLLED